MNSTLVKMLSQVYDNVTTTTIVLTDPDFNILYSNDEFTDTAGFKNIRNNLEIYPNTDFNKNLIIPVTIDDNNYTANIAPVREDGEIVGYIIRLVTAKEIVDQQLNKDLATSKADYHSSLRQYVSNIIGLSSCLSQSLEAAEMYDELRYLNRQVNNCYKILALNINKVEISKYSYGLIDQKKIELKSFIGDICYIINTILKSNNIKLNFTCSTSDLIVCDPDRLINMLLCLINNAIRYNISEQKEINISVKKSGFSVILSVTDNGVGMSNKLISTLFKNNERLSKDQIKTSLGMGYYIVNYFCKVFGATLMINSKENFGTTVSVKFCSDENSSFPLYLESKTADYLTNRFSNIYISLSTVTPISFF